MFARISSRSYATTASSSFKLVTKEFESPVSKIQVVVKNAGAKNNDKIGLSHLLSKFNFLDTTSKSGLRLKRESELLGGSYKSTVTRDDLILEAQFLKEDLPYFLNAIGSTLSEASFKQHEFDELVIPSSLYETSAIANDSKVQSIQKLHELSFRKGLGNSIYYDGVSKISLDELKEFQSKYFTRENLEIKSFGVVEKDLASFLETSSFSVLPSSSSSSTSSTSSASKTLKTFTGEQSRLRLNTPKTTASIGIPIPKGDESTFAALVALIKFKFPSSLILETDAKIANYSDASLFYVSLTSSNTDLITAELKSIVKELQNASGLSKLVKAAELESFGVDSKSIKDSFKLSKFNYAVVGNTEALPYAEEL